MAATSFGQQLRYLRRSRDLSLRRLADLLGVHYVYLSQLERGVETPSENLVRRIADIFGLSNVDELLLSVGKIPSNIRRILVENSSQVPYLLREHVGGTFMDRWRQEILEMWQRAYSNGMLTFPIVEEVRAARLKGFDVTAAEALIPEGHELHRAGQAERLIRHIALIRKALREAPKIAETPFESPATFEEIVDSLPATRGGKSLERHVADCGYPALDGTSYYDRVYGGWLGKCIGGALGAPIEGWTEERIRTTHGEVTGYLSPPSTVNDDTSYEIVFVHALREHGVDLTSEDLALEWLSHIPIGYTAEKVALDNLRKGIMPPLSGSTDNPYSEWIGAQMRGEVCGFIAPGRPDLAMKYAFMDGVISHEREGVYGEIYNAALVSLAFVEKDPRRLVELGLDFVPQRSRFAKVVRDSLGWCRSSATWREAWAQAQGSYLADYHWVHTFPNIAAVVIGLWFGEGDFDKTVCVTTMCGLDTDCTAGQAAAVVGTMMGAERIPSAWREPIQDRLDSEVIGFEHLSIAELSRWTVELGRLVLARART